MIKEQYLEIKKAVQQACIGAQRGLDACTLIAVSKTKTVEALWEAYEAGCRDFGENKVQELAGKYDKLPKDIRWHMIGHLQTNKVKYIVDKAFMIHGVDSLKLAGEINKEAAKRGLVVSILLEVNVAKEASKYGFMAEELLDAVREIAKLPYVRVEGLMTIAPYVEDAEQNSCYFQQLKQLSVDILVENIDNVYMNVLSMGMTGDYLVAIREGATYVRVGTGIFGDRIYN